MHLPATLRRRILYATAATLLAGVAAYALQPARPGQAPAAVSAGIESQALQAPATAAPAAGSADAPVATAVAPRPKVMTYKVQSGDVAGTIADRFGLKTSTILWANGLGERDLLQIGQELIIPAMDGMVHTIERDDTLWGIASRYDVDFTAIVQANPDVDPEALQPGQVLLVPGGQPQLRRATVVASRGGERAAVRGSLAQWPTVGTITDWFGWRTHPVYGTRHYHDGIDIGIPIGTPVAAAAKGRVTYVGDLGGYGLTIKVDHGDGIVTLYAHMSHADVKVGQGVGTGERIGLSGNTGVSTGPHLHFSLFVDGTPVDPLPWLP